MNTWESLVELEIPNKSGAGANQKKGQPGLVAPEIKHSALVPGYVSMIVICKVQRCRS